MREVGPVAERQVPVDRAVDVEPVGIVEVALVAVAAAVEEQHPGAGGNRGAVDLDVVFDPAAPARVEGAS